MWIRKILHLLYNVFFASVSLKIYENLLNESSKTFRLSENFTVYKKLVLETYVFLLNNSETKLKWQNSKHKYRQSLKMEEDENSNEYDKTTDDDDKVIQKLKQVVSSGNNDDVGDNQEDTSDIFDEAFIPSISDRLQVGYAGMDRACQTNMTEIVDLKRMTEVLSLVVKDLATLKRGLYFSKLTLQAEYDGRLEQVALELYTRVNERIAEIESIHKERIAVVRRSYKQQMSNALTKLSRDYHVFYGSKDAMAEAENRKKVEEMKRHQDMLRKNELAQKEMYEMLKMQVAFQNYFIKEQITFLDENNIMKWFGYLFTFLILLSGSLEVDLKKMSSYNNNDRSRRAKQKKRKKFHHEKVPWFPPQGSSQRLKSLRNLSKATNQESTI